MDKSSTPSKRLARRRIDGARSNSRIADHYLTHEQLWRIMQTCAAPKVAAAIRRIK